MSCLCEFEPVSLSTTAFSAGTDIGLKDLFVTDTEFNLGCPRHTSIYAACPTRPKARSTVAKFHAKIADCRRDNLHNRDINAARNIKAEELDVLASVKWVNPNRLCETRIPILLPGTIRLLMCSAKHGRTIDILLALKNRGFIFKEPNFDE